MKRLQHVCVSVLASLVIMQVAYASTEAVDLATDCAIVESQQPNKTSDLDGPRQYAVLWDTTHGVYFNYQPFSRFTILVGNLADSGFTMSCCGTGVNTVDLTQYDVIVICVGSSWNSSYIQVEIDSLLSYYNQSNQRVLICGDMNFCEDTYIATADNVAFSDNVFDWLAESGGILILGDNPGCNNYNINPVANAFNMTAGVASLSPADLFFTNFATHPIFNGIDTIYFRAAGEIGATTPSEVIAWAPTNQPTIAALDEFVGIVEGQKGVLDISRLSIKPNPFRQSTEISGMPAHSMIRIYDVSGRMVSEQQERIIGSELREGIYFVRVDNHPTEKVVKLK